MKLGRIVAIVLLGLMFTAVEGQAQCRSYTKKKCRPILTPYSHNGQLNTAVLFPGDKAEIMLTFYSGQEYRVVVCSMPVLGEVEYKIKDTDRNVIFSSEDTETDFFDFKVAATQQLIVDIKVPESDAPNGLMAEGCVSVLVGFKDN